MYKICGRWTGVPNQHTSQQVGKGLFVGPIPKGYRFTLHSSPQLPHYTPSHITICQMDPNGPSIRPGDRTSFSFPSNRIPWGSLDHLATLDPCHSFKTSENTLLLEGLYFLLHFSLTINSSKVNYLAQAATTLQRFDRIQITPRSTGGHRRYLKISRSICKQFSSRVGFLFRSIVLISAPS